LVNQQEKPPMTRFPSKPFMRQSRINPRLGHQGGRAGVRRFLPGVDLMEARTLLSTLTVQNNFDSGAGSLRAIVGTAPSGSTIKFASSVHSITLTSGDLDIATNLTIEGPGASRLAISGNGAGRIFDISGSAAVSICGMALADGLASSGGAILLNDAASLSISNCTVSHSVAIGGTAGTGSGGGIEDDSSGALTVTQSTFDANKAIATGPNGVPGLIGFNPGSIFAYGGAINLGPGSTSTATISDSSFAGNQALGGAPGASAAGGALSNSSNVVASMTVTGCTISGNEAIGEAGGDGEINFGSGQGGGINDFSSLTVTASTITDNLALGTPLASGAVPSQTVSSGSASAGGGVFCLPEFVPTATVFIEHSTIAGNKAKGGAGAAGSAGSVGEGGGISLILVNAGVVDGCTIAGNVASGGAGGTGAVGAPGAGGGIDLGFFSSVTLKNTFVLGNEAIGGAGNSAAAGGLAVGGGIDVGTGVVYGGSDSCSLTLKDSSALGNQAIGGAGGSGSKGGDASGGGVAVLPGSIAMIDATLIAANAVVGGAAGAGGSVGQGTGGGLFIGTTAEVTVSPTTFVVFNVASTSDDNIFATVTIAQSDG
jgi:hypothetical protein